MFSIFDKDGDGYITMEEVIQVLTSMDIHPSKEYIKEIFQQVDLDGKLDSCHAIGRREDDIYALLLASGSV